jgi:hypothetical protein
MKKGKSLLLLLLCGAMFLTFAVGSSSESSSESPSKVKEEKFSYTVDNSYADSFAYYIEGTVTNNTDREFSYVSISFICYDAAGNNLGTALDNTNNLLGKQTWKYKAMFLGSDSNAVDHCDYHETTSW